MPPKVSPAASDSREPKQDGRSAARRGLGLVAGFWIVIVALLGARVALFDEIEAARLAQSVATRIASLSTILPR